MGAAESTAKPIEPAKQPEKTQPHTPRKTRRESKKQIDSSVSQSDSNPKKTGKLPTQEDTITVSESDHEQNPDKQVDTDMKGSSERSQASTDEPSDHEEETTQGRRQSKSKDFKLTNVKQVKNIDEKKIHVRNISRSVTEDELRDYFEQFGSIKFPFHIAFCDTITSLF